MDAITSDVYNSKICILLTATIDPKGIVFMERDDPLIREKDYMISLGKWVKHTTYPLIFCENSGYNLGEIKNSVKNYANRIEFIQYNGQDFPRELGKGYGELLTLKYAVQHSNFIKNSDYIVKVNGRYFIENIGRITSFLSKKNSIYVVADLKRNLIWADTRTFAFKSSFVVEYLLNFQNLIDDSKGFYLEHALARAILRAVSDGHKWLPLPDKPVIVGYSGTSGKSYRNSLVRRIGGKLIHRLKNYLNEKY